MSALRNTRWKHCCSLWIGCLLLAGLVTCTSSTEPEPEIDDLEPRDPVELEDTLFVDASRLALRWLSATDSPETSQVHIPASVRDSFLLGLQAIAQDTLYPASDSVFTRYEIHTWPKPMLQEVVVFVDSTAGWTAYWRKGFHLTGNAAIDSLMVRYDLRVRRYDARLATHSAVLRSAIPLNLDALAHLFLDIPAVVNAQPMSGMGDGNDIQASIRNDTLYYDFQYKWGDCPAGCLSRHTWHFSVYPTAPPEVVYLGSEGHTLPDIES